MRKLLIDPSEFVVPLVASEDGEPDSLPSGRYDQLEAMRERLPTETIYLGEVNSEVHNWTSWELDDHVYLIPWQEDGFQWALFRISWDDNWGRYDSEPLARIRDTADAKTAAKKIISHWLRRCCIQGGVARAYRKLAAELPD
jgi:hypothetical protein